VLYNLNDVTYLLTLLTINIHIKHALSLIILAAILCKQIPSVKRQTVADEVVQHLPTTQSVQRYQTLKTVVAIGDIAA